MHQVLKGSPRIVESSIGPPEKPKVDALKHLQDLRNKISESDEPHSLVFKQKLSEIEQFDELHLRNFFHSIQATFDSADVTFTCLDGEIFAHRAILVAG